jgi:predicted O-methyltransferase YrrM
MDNEKLTSSSPSIVASKKSFKSILIQKLNTIRKDPKMSLVYLIMGPKKFKKFNQKHSCLHFDFPKNSLEELMIENSSIHEHLNTLYMLTVEFNLKNIVELGTQFGNSTIALLYAAKEIEGKVTTIDVDPCVFARKKITDLNLNSLCTFIQSDDTLIEWSEPIDHIFIDSNHSYEHVTKQLKKYEPFLQKNGIITLHDIVMQEFDSNGNPVEKTTKINSVMRAISDYIKDRDDLKFYKYFNCNGLGIIRKH